MDRATTIPWGASLQQLDDMMDTQADASTHHMTEKADQLRASIYQEFGNKQGINMEAMRQKVQAWYCETCNLAFAPLRDPDPVTALVQKLFQSLGQLRGLHKTLRDAELSKEKRMVNADVAVKQATDKVLKTPAGAQAPEEVRAAVVARLSGWVSDQLKAAAATVNEAKANVEKAEQALERDLQGFVETLHQEYKQSHMTKPWEDESLMQTMIADVEQQLNALDLGGLVVQSGTGGTDAMETKDKVAGMLELKLNIRPKVYRQPPFQPKLL